MKFSTATFHPSIDSMRPTARSDKIVPAINSRTHIRLSRRRHDEKQNNRLFHKLLHTRLR